MVKGLITMLENSVPSKMLQRLTSIISEHVHPQKMFKLLPMFAIGCLAGTYGGMYVAQNYNIPRVGHPTELVEALYKFGETPTREPPVETPTIEQPVETPTIEP